ncbi:MULTISPECIES: hypothetical protein [Streptomyces]|uniref:Uncharacterized protein n=1 Tax=Streptomyces ehimensis TaxID=68195 RepID=A0ABV9BTK2_9ACTN
MTTSKMPRRVKPTAPWPKYDCHIARAEVDAMALLVKGVPQPEVVRSTGLSNHHIRRLALYLAEDAQTPPQPRNVCQPRRRP